MGNDKYIADSFNNIGMTYHEQGKLEQALSQHEKALAIRKQVGIPADIAQSLHNVGDTYFKQGQLELAIEHFDKALIIYKRLGRDFMVDVADELVALNTCYGLLGKHEKSSTDRTHKRQIYTKSKRSSRKSAGMQRRRRT